ncbi:MAG: hypothetical protein ACFCU7_20555 [Pleurocapsa sp.]
MTFDWFKKDVLVPFEVCQEMITGGFGKLAIAHWSQVKEIRKKSREKPNHVKLRESRQLNDWISL